jgi:hypothetical protein
MSHALILVACADWADKGSGRSFSYRPAEHLGRRFSDIALYQYSPKGLTHGFKFTLLLEEEDNGLNMHNLQRGIKELAFKADEARAADDL